MPIIDDERNMLVLRIAYDGAPLSGKTTTLRTLATSLGAAITTPEERDGRTLYFDWVDYTGGLFDGRQIRCQIVSVPGQAELAERRRVIVESADAVVLVTDTRETELDAGLLVLQSLLRWSSAEKPPVGVVVQANKRDAADAVPENTLRARVAELAPSTAVVETVATSGAGVRETFVFAVRLALDRVRALSARGLLVKGRPEVGSPEKLLRLLSTVRVDRVEWGTATQAETSHEKVDHPQAGEETTRESSPAERSPKITVPKITVPKITVPKITVPKITVPKISITRTSPPEPETLFVPDPMMPGGFIWPPVDGRALLYEVVKLGLVPRRLPSGDWSASGGGWRFHSSSAWRFPEARGRAALIDQARFHSAHLSLLSPGRALILADAGSGHQRLWQLVRVYPSMRERLFEVVQTMTSTGCAEALVEAARHLLGAREAFRAARMPMPCTLWTVGDPEPVYVNVAKLGETKEDLEGEALLQREFVPLLRAIAVEREDFADILWALERLYVPGAPSFVSLVAKAKASAR